VQGMSKAVTIRIDLVVRLLLLVLIAFLYIIPGIQFLVLLFFIPVVAWVLWRDSDRIKELEKKLAAYERSDRPVSS
jgi:predicted tellurium resistance membrane protein TerC